MPSLVSGLEYDIFISYRHNDNRSGWVTEFVNALQEELAATIKEPLTIYFDKNPHDGLLETHNVDKSLEGKLKCLVFIPILSQTYCDPKSFAWQHEFCAFNKLVKEDQFGRDVKLSNGNVASRILPVKIHDLDAEDKNVIENEMGSVLRAIELIFRSEGVNRPLTTLDKKEDNTTKTFYRDQIHKTAQAIKELISAIRNPVTQPSLSTINQQLTNKPSRNRKPILITAASLIIVAAFYFLAKQITTTNQRLPLDKSIAVLPFVDLSPNRDQEYLGIGLMDEILNHLTMIGDLSPVSRTSSMVYSKSGKSIKEIAELLDVDNVLEGSVSKVNNKIKITIRLVDAREDRNLLSKTFERESIDIFQIESEVAEEVALALSATINPGEKQRINEAPAISEAAHELYLKAHAKLITNEEIIPELEEVIRVAPKFSRAYSDLAFRYMLRVAYPATTDPRIDAQISDSLLHVALSLDSNNDDAYWVKTALDLFVRWNPEQSIIDLEKIKQIQPSRSDLAHASYMAFCASGRFQESLQLCKAYFRRDKNFPGNWLGLANSYFYAGESDKALETFQAATKVLETPYLYNDNQILIELGQLKIFLGDYRGAIGIYEPMDDHTLSNQTLGYLGIAYAKTGNTEKLNAMIKRLEEKSQISSGGSPAYFLATIFTALNNREMALQWLQTAYERHEVEMFWLKVSPLFNSIRADEGFQEILRKMNMK